MKKPAKRRKYADGGNVQDPATPPIGTTDLSGAASQSQTQPSDTTSQDQTSPYSSPSDYVSGDQTPVGAMKMQNNNPYVKNRTTGQGSVATGYAKGGLVGKRGKVRGCGVAVRGLTKGRMY
jgi:hypothetical protein